MPLTAPGITKEEVQALAPELAGAALSDGAWAVLIANVNAQVNEAVFATAARARVAALYLAAHLATFAKTTGGAGGSAPVQSESVGDVSVTYAISMAQDVSSLQQTFYGREYQRLCRTSVVIPVL